MTRTALLSLVLLVQMQTIGYSAQDPSTASLVKLESIANLYCRQGGESKETDAWCSVREALGGVLAARDWCHGKKNQDSIDYTWHACGSLSLRAAE